MLSRAMRARLSRPHSSNSPELRPDFRVAPRPRRPESALRVVVAHRRGTCGGRLLEPFAYRSKYAGANLGAGILNSARRHTGITRCSAHAAIPALRLNGSRDGIRLATIPCSIPPGRATRMRTAGLGESPETLPLEQRVCRASAAPCPQLPLPRSKELAWRQRLEAASQTATLLARHCKAVEVRRESVIKAAPEIPEAKLRRSKVSGSSAGQARRLLRVLTDDLGDERFRRLAASGR